MSAALTLTFAAASILAPWIRIYREEWKKTGKRPEITITWERP